MENPAEAGLPPRLEVLVIRGVSNVVHGTDKIACQAIVLTPETGCMSRKGQSVICDRVLRFYDASAVIKSHRPIAEDEKVSLQKEDNGILTLLVDEDVYTVHAPEGKRMDIKWGDFTSMDNQSTMARRQAINKYVLSLLNKPA
jgi:hypothetical protein